MKLTEKEKLQECMSELRFIAKVLSDSGDIHRAQNVQNVVNNISFILKNMEEK